MFAQEMKDQSMIREIMWNAVKGALGIFSALLGLSISYLADIKEVLQVLVLIAALVASILTSASLYVGLREKRTKNNKTKIMKTKTIFAIATVLLFTVGHNLRAENALYSSGFVLKPFASAELPVNALDQLSSARVGYGLAAQYWLNESIGFETSALIVSPSQSFIDNGQARVLWRLPLGDSGLAPYGFGGVDYGFETENLRELLGGGIEFRHKRLSVFGEVAALFDIADSDVQPSLQARVGAGLSF